MRCIAIFGACREGLEVYRNLLASSILNNDKINFIFIDNDSRLLETKYEDIPVFNPKNLDFNTIDLIVVGVISFQRIRTQLNSLGVPDKKIKRFYSEKYFSHESRKIGMASIGKYSYYKPSTILYNVEIGNYCHIGADCRLGLIGHDINAITTYPFEYQFGKSKNSLDCSMDSTKDLNKINPLRIGHDVYIGEGVTIMAGIQIGIGAVIGSRSVVTKDVPPFTVVAGVPAKVVKRRLTEQKIEALLKSKWWELNKEEAKIIIDGLL